MARSSLNLGAFLTGLASVASGREQALQENRMEAQQQQFQSWQSQMQGQQADEAGLDDQFGQRLNTLKMMMSMPDLTPESQQALTGSMQQLLQQQEAAQGQMRQRGQTLRGQDPRIRRGKGQMPQQAPGVSLPAFAPPTPQIDTERPAREVASKSLYNDEQRAGALDPELAGKISGIRARLEARQITREQAEAEMSGLRGEIRTKEQARLTETEASRKRMEARDLADLDIRKNESVLREAERQRVEQNRLRDDQRSKEDKARTTGTNLLTRFQAATKRGNIPEAKAIARQHLALQRQFPDTLETLDPDLDPTPQEGETPEAATARVEERLAEYTEDPKIKRDQLKTAIGQLHAVFKGSRWNQLDEASQSKIIDRIGALEDKAGVPSTLPAHLKTLKLTPAQEEQKRRWEITNLQREEKIVREKQAHSKRLEHIDRRIKIADQQLKGTYAPSRDVKYSSSELAAVKAASEKLKSLRISYAAALKNPEQEGGKTLGRWQQLVGEAEAELDAAIKQPAAAVNGAMWKPEEQQAIDILTRTNKPGTTRPFTVEEAQNRVRNKRGR